MKALFPSREFNVTLMVHVHWPSLGSSVIILIIGVRDAENGILHSFTERLRIPAVNEPGRVYENDLDMRDLPT